MRIMQDLRSSLLRAEVKKSIPSHLRLLARIFLLAAVFLSLLLSPAGTAFAGSATWNLNPTNGDWNTATNWMPVTVPNGPSDMATFGVSNTTDVSLSGNIEVNGIVFNPGASAFTITASATFALTISGLGITNNSGITQNLGAGRLNINFENAASAGTSTFFTANGFWQFFGSSSAGTATFIIEGGRVLFTNTSSAATGTFFTLGSPTFSGSLFFANESTAGNGTFTTSSSPVTDGFGAETVFLEVATAADGIFFTNGGAFSGLDAAALTVFEEDSTAGNATLIANGGVGVGGEIIFLDDSTGGTARVEVFSNGKLDISQQDAGGVTIGSIAGDGIVFLGANNLAVGSNLSTLFSGVIQDGGRGGGTGGSLTKIGSGTLMLSGANTYTGGTTIDGGKLIVSNTSGSGTGTGSVQVNKGTLRGRGTIAGAVTLGTGSGPGAVLSPGQGRSRPRTLTIQSTLTFNSDATYAFGLNSKTGIADKVMANGVTIVSGAHFSFAEFGNCALVWDSFYCN